MTRFNNENSYNYTSFVPGCRVYRNWVNKYHHAHDKTTGGIRLGLNKLFFFSSLLFYSFMLVLSTYNSFDYTYYSLIILIKKMFKNVIHIYTYKNSLLIILQHHITTLGSLALEVSDREELLDAIFAKCHVLLPQVRMRWHDHAYLSKFFNLLFSELFSILKSTYYSQNYASINYLALYQTLLLQLC